MTTPTIEDLARTYWEQKKGLFGVTWDDMAARTDDRSVKIVREVRAGLLAVLDKRVGPMLVDAIIEGNEIDGTVDYFTAERRVARILKSVKGE